MEYKIIIVFRNIIQLFSVNFFARKSGLCIFRVNDQIAFRIAMKFECDGLYLSRIVEGGESPGSR